MKLLSLFSGIGAFEKALDKIGARYELVNYCEIDKDASKSYSLIHNISEEKNLWDINKVTGEGIEADIITYGFPCFQAGTLVRTSNGYTPIEQVHIGDYVLTHKNRYKRVVQTMSRETQQVYKIKGMGFWKLTTTENHPFFVRKMVKKWNNIKRTYERMWNEPEWIKAKNLSKEYYMTIPVNQTEKLPEIETTLPLNKKNFWWLVGRWLGDGWVTSYPRKGRKNSMAIRTHICCAKNEDEEIRQHIEGLFHYTFSPDRTVDKFIVTQHELGKFLMRYGKGAKNKFIHQEILDLPIPLLKAFLDGYMSADGCYTQGKYKACSVSKQLITGIAECINKVYKTPCSLHQCKRPHKCIIDGRLVNQNTTYEVVYQFTSKREAFYENGYIYTPIRLVTVVDEPTVVYNLSVEEDESYTANRVVAHNCTDLSNAGKQAGFFDENGNKTRSGLVWDAMRVIGNVKPKFALCENVKALASKKFEKGFNEILQTLEQNGYNNYYKVLNSMDYGIPQSRERIFILSIRKDIDKGYEFPKPVPLKFGLRDIIETREQDDLTIPFFNFYKKTHTNATIESFIQFIKDLPVHMNKIVTKNLGLYSFNEMNTITLLDGVTGTLTCRNVINYNKKFWINNRLYRPSPKMCMQLQGFLEKDYNKIKDIIPESQIWKQAGNSITVDVLAAIFGEIVKRYNLEE